jgi:GR25 family glycosyltransferase involved in LPS biosynthesis
MKNIPIYILSLDYRIDRQDRISSELLRKNVKFEFIISSKQANKNFEALPGATQIEVAIWYSHIQAMEKLLASGSDWGLILEDDAIIQKTSYALFESQINKFTEIFGESYGIIQLGWIPNSKKKGIQKYGAYGFRLLFGLNRFDLKSKINYISSSGYKQYRSMSRQLRHGMKLKMVPLLGMRLGAHAYLIHKNTAQILINRFEERLSLSDFKTIDQDLLQLTLTPDPKLGFKAVRFSKNLIGQSQEDSDNNNKTVY